MRNWTGSDRTPIKNLSILPIIAVLLLAAAAASAAVPPRFYWKTLSGTNAIPVISTFIEGNINPLDPSQRIPGSANIEGEVITAGYAKIFTFRDRSAMAAVLLPMGNLRSDVTIGAITSTQSTTGFGDPLLEFTINLIGPKSITNLAQLERYEPGFSLDLLIDVALPLGEYDDDQSLNIGQNRWYGRIGTPIIWQLGAWVPGRRTTLEIFPSVWFFGDNDDFVGQDLESDPTFELDVHLTRDFAHNLWGSVDVVYTSAGDTKLNRIESDGEASTMVGFTIGYELNQGMQLTLGYQTALNDNDPDDVDMSMFTISLVAGWHSLLEGVRRLGE